MNSKTKKKLIIYPIVYAVLVALFLIGTFFDLNISKAIADVKAGEYFSNNLFANVIECFGELPIYFILGSSVCIVGYTLASKNEKYKLVAIIITNLIVFAMFTICFSRCVESLGEVYDFTDSLEGFGDEICAILFGLCFVTLSIWLYNVVDLEKIEKLFYFAITFIVIIALTFIITQVLKRVVSRPRYRALNLIGFDKYSPWYKVSNAKNSVNGGIYPLLKDDGFVSFPSGHVSWTFTSILLCFLPRFIKLNKKATLCFTIIPITFGALVAFARIVAGAHFLTDVTFSAIVTLLLEELAVFTALKLKAKKDKKEQEDSNVDLLEQED